MRISEVTAPAASLLELGKQLQPMLDAIPVPNNRRVKLTKHLLTKMTRYNIRANIVAAMVRKAFRVHREPLSKLDVNNRIVLRKTDRTGLVIVKNTMGDYVLATIDPTLYNEVNPSPELRV